VKGETAEGDDVVRTLGAARPPATPSADLTEQDRRAVVVKTAWWMEEDGRERCEREVLLEVLSRCGGRAREAARRLGCDRSTIAARCRALGIVLNRRDEQKAR
jgi:transcriptional regulator of acetoin/glycerol metabolism